MTMPGVPMVFAGDELGLEGAWGEDARRTMPWDRPESWDADLFASYARLIALRRVERGARARRASVRGVGEDAIAYLREHGDERLLCLAARADHEPIRSAARRARLPRARDRPRRRRVVRRRHRDPAGRRSGLPRLEARWLTFGSTRSTRSTTTASAPCRSSRSRSPTASSSSSSARRAAARRRRCGWSRASRRSPTGTVSIGGRVVNDLTPKERDIAMVFQNYALYPHLSVADNIAFGLRLRKTPKAVIAERVAWAAKLLDLTPYLDRRPKQLSGGQRQRVAMGRAIVRQPQVFLMDEPLSNLDAKLRVQMRADIAKLQRRPRDDDDLRHPRPGRGDDDGRPCRGDEQRCSAAGRHAAAPLRPAREPLRRRLHRHAADEPARGGRRGRRRARSR